jgi:chromatin remodeling complex protein RSC6
MKPVKLQSELAAMLGAKALPRTEITKQLWAYIKANKLQTKTANGKPENAGKFIVVDEALLPIVRNTKSTSKGFEKFKLFRLGSRYLKSILDKRYRYGTNGLAQNALYRHRQVS